MTIKTYDPTYQPKLDYVTRNKELIEKRKQGWTLEKIGIFFGISRERVRQKLEEAGLSHLKSTSKHLLSSASKYQQLNTNLTTQEMKKLTGRHTINWFGLRHKLENGSQVAMGQFIENYVSDIMTSLGIKHRLTTYSRPIDIVLADGRLIEIRSRHKPQKGFTSDNFYVFQLKQYMNKNVSFFILVIVDGDKKDCFIVPRDEIYSHGGVGFVWPTTSKSKSKYLKFHERWDLLV